MAVGSCSVVVVLMVLFVSCNGEVKTITDDNWSQILSGHWMIEFYAPWCPHCNSFTPIWEEFGRWAENEDDLQVGKVDVTEQPILAGQFLVMHLPTIVHIKDGIVSVFEGNDRSFPGLRKYVIDEKWSDVELIPWYKSPTSLHMRGVGYMFILAKQLQVMEEYLRNTYDIPTWGIFAIIAGITVVFGLSVGLIFICLCDFICRKTTKPTPTRRRTPPPPPTSGQQVPPSESKPEPTPDAPTDGVRKRTTVEGQKKSETDS